MVWFRVKSGVVFSLLICLISLSFHAFSQDVSLVFNRLAVQDGLSNNSISYVLKDKFGFVWVGTWDGLNRYDGYSFTIFKHDFNDSTTLSENRVNSIFLDKDKNLWIETFDNKLNKFDYATEHFGHYPLDTFSAQFRDSIAQFNTGNQRFNYSNKKIEHNTGVLFMLDGALRTPLSFDFANPHSPTENVLVNHYLDDRGLIWFGSRSGLSILNSQPKEFVLYQKNANNGDLFLNNNVRAISEDSDGNLWIGTTDQGVTCYNRKTRSSFHLQIPLLTSNVIRGIYQDSKGYVWVCAREGLDRYDPKTKAVTHFLDKLDTDVPMKRWVYGALEDTSGNLWFATFGGVLLFNRETETFTRFSTENQMLGGNLVRYLVEDDAHSIWATTEDGGVTKIMRNGKGAHALQGFTSKIYQYNATDSTTISANRVNNCTLDYEGNLWFATAEGLALYNKKTDSFMRIHAAGIPKAMIESVLADKNGNIWFGCSSGLYRYNSKTGVVRQYQETDGLQGNGFGDALFRSKSGEMFFGGSKGFNSFFPDKIKDNTNPPKVYFTKLFVNNEIVEIGKLYHNDILLTEPIYSTQKIVLTHLDYIVNIEFAALYYANPQAARYMYQLEGFSDKWVSTDASNRVVTFTNLDPGTYTLKVKTANSDGIWSAVPTELTIEVLPPWWATWWFRTLLVLGILFISVSYYRLKVKQLKAQKAELEEKVKLRTSELVSANQTLQEHAEEILQQKEEIQVQRDEVFSKNSELESKNAEILEQQENLQRANINIQLISDFGQKITSSLNLEAIEELIYEYVSSLMDTTAIGIGVYNPTKELLEFKNFVELGERKPYFAKSLDMESSLAVQCFVRREVLLQNKLSDAYRAYLVMLPEMQDRLTPNSSIHVPLIAEDRAIGVLLINSIHEDVYSEKDVANLRSLASYITIALDNAAAYRMLNVKNEAINDSIRYGFTIQQAILPNQSTIEKYFDNFIVFRPRDVVSGDFYWFAKVKHKLGDFTFLATVDCTGHGVPGAFMSMIANTLLNEIVTEKHIVDTGEILNRLNLSIQKVLKQAETKSTDGMDICLARFCNLKTEGFVEVMYSGAKSPLYHYFNKTGKIEIIQADPYYIGHSNSRRTERTFVAQTFVLEPKDILYLSTDGFTDQNNKERKRFGKKRLLELLEQHANETMANQKVYLENELDGFQNTEKQRDDITLIGIRPKLENL